MSLAEDLQRLQENPTIMPSKCAMVNVFTSLTDEEQIALNKVLDNKSIPATAIAKLLSDNGFGVGKDTIYRHRRRKVAGDGCRCPQ